MKKTRFHYIDVSEHNGNIDFEKLSQKHKRGELDGVMIRLSLGFSEAKGGVYRMDKRALEYARACAKYGIPFGFYHYSYAHVLNAKANALLEAEGVVKILKEFKVLGLLPSLPIAFDIEDNNDIKGGDHGDYGRPNWQARTEMAYTFCEYLEQQGYFAMVYASADWFLHMGDLSRFAKWVAHWDVERPAVDCQLWQYTSRGNPKEYGTEGNGLDLNVSHIDFEAVIKGKELNGFEYDHVPRPAPITKRSLRVVKQDQGYFLVDDMNCLVANTKIIVNAEGRLLLEEVRK